MVGHYKRRVPLNIRENYKREPEPENGYITINEIYRRELGPENGYTASNENRKRGPQPQDGYIAMNEEYEREPDSESVRLNKVLTHARENGHIALNEDD